MRPYILEPAGDRTPGNPVARDGDTIRMVLPEWRDSSASGHSGYRDTSTDTTAFRVYRNGALLGAVSRPRATIRLGPDRATYRFEVDTARKAEWWPTSTRTFTAWTIESERTSQPTSTLPPGRL